MCLLASKWRLRNKSQLLFVIELFANNFVFPGIYSYFPFVEKIIRTILSGSFSTDNKKNMVLEKNCKTPNRNCRICDVFWDKVVK